MYRWPGVCVLAAAIVTVSAACGDGARPSGGPTPPSTDAQTSGRQASASTSPTTPSAELVTAVADYVRARNGTNPAAYRESMCESVRDHTASRQPTADVVVDRIADVRVDGQTATVTVDLSYLLMQAGSNETFGPVRGVEWTFRREGGLWKQCTPPPFGTAAG